MKAPARLEKQTFFDDPLIDALVNSLTGVAIELSVVKERLDTLERALESKGISAAHLIESFQPDEDCSQRRTQARARIISAVLGPLEAHFLAEDSNHSKP